MEPGGSLVARLGLAFLRNDRDAAGLADVDEATGVAVAVDLDAELGGLFLAVVWRVGVEAKVGPVP